MRAIEDSFYDRCRQQIQARWAGSVDVWLVVDIVSDVALVRQMLYDNGGRIDLDWPIRVCTLARIIDEKQKQVKHQEEQRALQG